MRKLVTLWLVTLLLLAACSAGGANNEGQATGTHDDVAAITLITPESGGGYPAPANPYPVSPVEALLPTDYPGMAISTMPPTDLTPDAGANSAATSPPTDRPLATPYPVPDRVLATLVRELSALADVPIDEIDVAAAEPVVWPNAGLGCPAEGMVYAEVQVEGMLIVLAAGGRDYTFHTDGAQRYVLCRDGRPISEGNIKDRG